MENKVLFMVGSMYQLFNVIILRVIERQDSECDLMLRSSTIWDEDVLTKLKEKKLFNKILCPDITEKEKEFWFLSLEERLEIFKNPLAFFEEPPIETLYDELFFAVDHISWKLVFRYEVMNGKVPKVFMFDEGVRSYTLDMPKSDERPYLKNEYADMPMINAIEAHYIHQPELYSVKKYNYEIRKIPNPLEHLEVKELLLEIYGSDKMPEEPYIYLEDYFFVDRHITNDLQLFCEVAAIVGKENIIVKRHPRDDYDRFTPLGYKTVERSVVPWEIQLLANDLRFKVLISVSSTSILTPYLIFNSNIHVISLEKMFIGQNPVHADEGFNNFFNSMISKVNENEVYFHTPSSVEELREVLRYIKLMHKITKDTKDGKNDE